MKNKLSLLVELKVILTHKFAGNISEVRLFGSRAYGKANKDSDYDILIILKNDYDWKYKNQILYTCFDFESKYDIFLDVKIISVNELQKTIRGLNPIYEEAINNGILL